MNWGAWSVAEYKQVCVWDPEHPEHAEFQRIMADPIFDDPRVFIGNMAPIRARKIRYFEDHTLLARVYEPPRRWQPPDLPPTPQEVV